MRSPRFRTKDVSTCMGSPTARGSSSPSHSGGRMLPSRPRTGSAPRNSTRFAAQYPARGLPCERFKLSLAASPCITRGRGGWLGLTPWKTLTSYPLPAYLAHTAMGQFEPSGQPQTSSKFWSLPPSGADVTASPVVSYFGEIEGSNRSLLQVLA